LFSQEIFSSTLLDSTVFPFTMSTERLLALLASRGQARAQELAEALGVSQPTVSPLIQAAGDRVCRMGRTRATRYARTRALPGLEA